MHMTAQEAAQLASGSGADKLVLMHYSARYKDVGKIRAEAKDVFKNVVCGEDFMKIKV